MTVHDSDGESSAGDEATRPDGVTPEETLAGYGLTPEKLRQVVAEMNRQKYTPWFSAHDIEPLAYARWRTIPGEWLDQPHVDALACTPATIVSARMMDVLAPMHFLALFMSSNGEVTVPVAMSPIFRQSMLASAYIIWLLSPADGTERTARFARDIDENQFRTYDFNAAVGRAEGDPTPTGTAMRKCYEQTVPARTLRQHFGTLAKKPTDTEVWNSAARHCHENVPKNMKRLELEWKLLSGDAHSYIWAKDARDRIWRRSTATGPVELEVNLPAQAYVHYREFMVDSALAALQLSANHGLIAWDVKADEPLTTQKFGGLKFVPSWAAAVDRWRSSGLDPASRSVASR